MVGEVCGSSRRLDGVRCWHGIRRDELNLAGLQQYPERRQQRRAHVLNDLAV
jgi:hypothetical protein